MKNVFDIFTSLARVKVLRTLSFQGQAIPLRHIACISGLPVFSVQKAAQSLFSEGILVRREKDNNVLFELNKGHTLHDLIVQFFVLEGTSRLLAEAKAYFGKARRALEFANSANVIFKIAKGRGP